MWQRHDLSVFLLNFWHFSSKIHQKCEPVLTFLRQLGLWDLQFGPPSIFSIFWPEMNQTFKKINVKSRQWWANTKIITFTWITSKTDDQTMKKIQNLTLIIKNMSLKCWQEENIYELLVVNNDELDFPCSCSKITQQKLLVLAEILSRQDRYFAIF